MRGRIAVGLLAGLCMCLATGAGASTIWEKTTIGSSYTGADDVCTADVNGDGRQDVVAASTNGVVNWWRNAGQGVFDSALNTVTAAVPGATSVFAANLDGDSDVDIVTAGSAILAWCENTGSGWIDHVINSGMNGPNEALALDVDRDGDQDVVSIDGSNLIWYQNNGTQFFLPNTITAFSNGMSVAAGDLDSDLDVDLLACGSNDVVWYENNGSQVFTPHSLTTTFNNARGGRIADLNNDGRPDLAAVSNSNGWVWWWRNNGAGSFTAFSIANQLSSCNDLYPADLDGDNDLDLVSTQVNSDYSVIWFENHGSGSFGWRVLAGGWNANDAWAADVTGDGIAEVLVSSGNQSQISYWHSRQTTAWDPEYLLRDATTYANLHLNANRLYIGQTFHAQIEICDVANPARPVVIGGYDQLGGDDYNPARFLALSGNHLYVSNAEESLFQVLDVSNPAAPVLVNQWRLNNNARGIVLSGNTAFVGDTSGNLYTFAIADPAALTLNATAKIGNQFNGMALAGNYLYIADRAGYLTVADVANPTAVAWVSSTTMTSRAEPMEVEIAGNYAYVTTLQEGLLVLDISNPASPAIVGRFTPFGTGMDVAVSGNRLLFTTASKWYPGVTVGLYLLDITTPASPALLQAYTYVGETADSNNDGLHNVVFNGDYAYAAIWGQGLGVFRWNAAAATPVPTSPATVSKRIDGVLAYPNPAKGVVNFWLEEPAAERASVEFFNLAGELVTQITVDQPGRTFAWTVRDVAPGLYMYRTTITVNGEERKLKIKKLAILK